MLLLKSVRAGQVLTRLPVLCFAPGLLLRPSQVVKIEKNQTEKQGGRDAASFE